MKRVKIPQLQKVVKKAKSLPRRQQVVLAVLGGLVVIGAVVAGGRVYTRLALRNQYLAQSGQLEQTQEEALFQEADRLYRQQSYTQAATLFQEYARTQANYGKFHGLMRAAEAWERAEQYQSALENYLAATNIASEGITAAEYANAYSGAAQMAEALEQYEIASQYYRSHIQQLEAYLEQAEQEQQVTQQIANAKRNVEQLRIQIQRQQAEQVRQLVKEAETILEKSEEPTPEQLQAAAEKYRQALDLIAAGADIPEELADEYLVELQLLQSARSSPAAEASPRSDG